MNKGELLDVTAAKTKISKQDGDAAFNAVLKTIVEAVSQGNKVTLIGFGSFELRERQAQEGRSPKSEEAMTIPATKVPAFAPASCLSKRLSRSSSHR